MKALVLAGGVPQIKLLEELKSRGYYTILADYFENPVAKPYADKFYRNSTLDLDAIRRISRNENIDLLITCCTDQALATVSQISEEMGLPCYVDGITGLKVTNKQYMKRIMMENGIPTADYKIVDHYIPEDSMKFPLVVKPVDCNSSKGVRKVYDACELKTAVESAVQISRTGTAIVEKYVVGKEISVDLFVRNGIATILCVSYSEKIQDNQKFVIFKGQYPAEMSEAAYEKLINTAQKLVDSFQLINCPMLMQVLLQGDDISVIEFSARTGGGIKYHMIELVSGFDVIKATVDLFEGKTPDVKVKQLNKVVVNEFIYCCSGHYSRMKGIRTCLDNGWIESFFALKESGERMEKVQSSSDRIAALTYVADDYEDYRKKHNKVIEIVKVIDSDGNDMMRHDLLPPI